MKQSVKLLLLVGVFALAGLTKAQAQVDVMVNPIGLLFGNLSASADFMLKDNFSVEGQIGVGFGDDGAFDYFNLPITAYGKYYFNPDDGADKFYASAFLRFINRSWDGNDNAFVSEYSQTRVGLGFGVGYKVVGNSGIVFDLGFGIGRAFIDNVSIDDETNVVDWPEIMFTGKLAIGYRFGG
ncbi:hypothetical protein [Phaeodactylibacter xiamenensis]|jgi:hypothetical protein|uniref:hypothetical protein n=1 Tax=Phaeodactylibacter xiamenensis TaxID=1524460 RepID=UPI0024A80CEB|nr:hypothetical protein [Phaeodactylibacter xiamenensis]